MRRYVLATGCAWIAACAGSLGATAAATAPTAITGAVSAVTPSGATLNGTVNPNGLATSWSFEYGTTTAYGSQTSPQPLAASSTDTAVSLSLTGLTPGTTYHYRLDATSSGGTSDGSDGIFTTPSAPGVVTGSATSVAGTSATLGGTVYPNGEATTYSFEYGTTTSYGSSTPQASAGSGTSAVAVSAPVSGLAASQTYHFRLVATSAAGTSDGSDGTFTTPPPPSVVTGSATSVARTSATLNGSVNPNGTATSYSFEYGTTTTYGSSTPQASAGSGTSAVAVSAPVSGLAATQTYHFRLVATSASGTTDGPDMSFKLASAPSATTSPTVSISGGSARLSGTVNPEGQATTWVFQYGTTTSYGSTTASAGAGSGNQPVSVSTTIGGLTAATVYHFRLVARNASGTSDGSDQSFASSPPPLVETGSAQSAGPTSVTLTGAVNPRGGKTTFYFQYGPTTAYGGTSAITAAGSGTANQTVTVQIVKLQPTTTYHYRLVAANGAGTSYGGDVTFTTPSAVTLIAETSQSVFGHAVTLSGIAAGSPAGAKVTVLAEPIGHAAFTSVATVTTASDGSWSFQARPAIATSYEVSTGSGTSTPVTIGVRPAISLRRITRARLLIRVVASTAFTGRLIEVQRLRPQGGWATVVRTRLNGRSSAVVAASVLPRGSSTVRVAMSVNQAGRGFLAGFSRTLLVTRS